VLTPADPYFFVDKRRFTVPFVCGSRQLGEAVRRIYEGAAMIRTKGEAGTGNVVEAVRHMRLTNAAIADLQDKDDDDLHRVAVHYAKNFAHLKEEVLTSMGLPAKIDIHERIFGEDSLEDIEVVLHAILDGWSLGLLFPEVLASYRAFRAGREPEQASVGPYREFIVWLQGRDAAVLTTRGASKRRACRGCSGT